MSGLLSPRRLRQAAEILEREGFGDVAGVLRLAAGAEEAVGAHLAAPGASHFGRLTNALPGLLAALVGRAPGLFYSPTVAALLSMLGSRYAKGEIPELLT